MKTLIFLTVAFIQLPLSMSEASASSDPSQVLIQSYDGDSFFLRYASAPIVREPVNFHQWPLWIRREVIVNLIGNKYDNRLIVVQFPGFWLSRSLRWAHLFVEVLSEHPEIMLFYDSKQSIIKRYPTPIGESEKREVIYVHFSRLRMPNGDSLMRVLEKRNDNVSFEYWDLRDERLGYFTGSSKK